jgi:hypothetical protein
MLQVEVPLQVEVFTKARKKKTYQMKKKEKDK